MSNLKESLAKKIEEHRPRTQRLVKEYGDVKVCDVTISQVIGGMRGIKCLVTDISYLDPIEGIRFRGYTIPEVLKKLPKPKDAEMPYVEGFFYLLLTGDIPTENEIKSVVDEFKNRKRVPKYVFDVIRSYPRDAHPMTMFSMAILSMQRESIFAKAYSEGKVTRMNAWEYMYEDCMNLMAKLPEIGAYIYRMKYREDTPIESNPELDLGADFAHMMGIDKPYDDLMRLYFILHSDHESGNVSAHTTHLVASAYSDAYYSLSAGMNGLAGPLHGLANQECLKWVQNMMKDLGDRVPTKEEAEKYCWDTLNSGQVIPGYGHAVLRATDPRYMAQREWCLKHLPDDPVFKTTSLLYEVVPPILEKQGKAKNPWPNVDAHSGVIQWHYGVKEYEFYTVLFGIGRALGVLANITWDRALGYPIERPKSVTTDMLEEIAGIKK
ncbi:MAG: citrate (Si)-synthase [Deferribacterota bacterium]|nr:citrate (Si)-synthase [Deferribacterota bacterium]